MKKILFTFLVLLLPSTSYAEIDVFLSSNQLEYGRDVWTSANYPQA